MRIREGCILTATNSSDERVKSLIGCKGALHVVNGEPLRFVVGTNENARSFTTATTKRLGVIGVNIFVSTVTVRCTAGSKTFVQGCLLAEWYS